MPPPNATVVELRPSRRKSGQAVRPLDVFATDAHVYAVGNDTGPFFSGDFSVFGIQPNGSLHYQGGRDFGICGSAYVEGTLAYVGCGSWYILDLTDPFDLRMHIYLE